MDKVTELGVDVEGAALPHFDLASKVIRLIWRLRGARTPLIIVIATQHLTTGVAVPFAPVVLLSKEIEYLVVAYGADRRLRHHHRLCLRVRH